ncbi:MAG TPA: acyl-CoA dehydrogenase family protein [Myxococcota bacterium]|nr:acyl-CoA dehydrogenase family protein [Myxococcota bacterium]HQK50260.1 acyl-CoA dehydrogenase family protein [Myxococcota bacterium]
MIDPLLSDAGKALREEVRDFVKSVPRDLILAMDRDEVQFPKEFLAEAGRRNLMGARYPREWGGRGLTWVDTCMVMEEVGTLGYIFACIFGVGAELVCDAVLIHGTDEQKERYVRPLLQGRIFAAECLTEPRGGSDFFGATTRAVRDGDDWVISGAKRFIVGGAAADYFLVYARTDPEAPPHKGITAFLVDRGPGVETDYLYGLMGCRGGGAARVRFHEVRVPGRNVLGRVNGGVEVFYTMMIPERLGTAAMTIGAARPALEIATRYTRRRRAFGRPIKEFQGVSFQVAESAMLLDACRAMAYMTARAVDAGEPPGRVRRLVSESKKFITESCQQVARHAMQVMGGIGYTRVYPVERIVRDLALASIWTGTSEIMSQIIATEWYKEREALEEAPETRDVEGDAEGADDLEEKDFG